MNGDIIIDARGHLSAPEFKCTLTAKSIKDLIKMGLLYMFPTYDGTSKEAEESSTAKILKYWNVMNNTKFTTLDNLIDDIINETEQAGFIDNMFRIKEEEYIYIYEKSIHPYSHSFLN